MTFTIHPVILCGGSGTRLWPLSTPETPKQFLALTSSKSMIEDTAGRFQSTGRSDLDFASLLVIGSKRHEKLLAEKLPDTQMVLEPMGRNSAPAVAAAAMMRDPDDLILILPADHDIRNIPAFHDAIAIAANAAEDGAIVTFGIQPTHAATGYGYIKAVSSATQSGAMDVEAFVEKPDAETAQRYLDARDYYWNAGIFLFKAGVILDALETYAPGVNTGTRAALGSAQGGAIYLDAEAFAATPSISIDYAVMEKASNVKTVPVSMGWSDVGGYRALHELLTQNETENYTSGPVHVQNSSGLYVRSEGPAITVNGLSDLVVVATNNAVMITPKNADAAVKEMGKIVQEEKHKLSISRALQQAARDWLWNAIEVWSNKAWDSEHGGFVECLDLSGAPLWNTDRRVRVQARQVFSFAKAIELGFPQTNAAEHLVNEGIEYLDSNLRHPEGGWVHVIEPNGQTIDNRRDLYDHAFLIAAGAVAFRATGNQKALKIAQDSMRYVDEMLKDPIHSGWFESDLKTLPRRANPHMHMLEAMLEYHAATGCTQSLQHASAIVTLFETKFFNPANNVMAEFFESDWSVSAPVSSTLWEPGHHYEWATLLCLYEDAVGHDNKSWRHRLIKRADASGLNHLNFAVNSVTASGKIADQNCRLWHQWERFRAYLYHPSVASTSKMETTLQNILSTYLNPAPPGGWIDEIDANGKPLSSTIPASMLYHAITALTPIL